MVIPPRRSTSRDWGGIPGVATDYRGAPRKNEHVLIHVPSKLPSLRTGLLNSSTGLRAVMGQGLFYVKRGLYTMCSWNLAEKGSAQFSHCAMMPANLVSCSSHSAISHQSGSPERSLGGGMLQRTFLGSIFLRTSTKKKNIYIYIYIYIELRFIGSACYLRFCDVCSSVYMCVAR